MAQNGYSLIAGGAINTAVFVSGSNGNNRTVVQAAGTTPIVGVAPDAAALAPIPGASTNAANNSGDQLNVNFPGTVCLVRVGASAGVTAWDKVVSDSLGCAVTAAAAGGSLQYIGGQVLESANANELVPMRVWPEVLGNA